MQKGSSLSFYQESCNLYTVQAAAHEPCELAGGGGVAWLRLPGATRAQLSCPRCLRGFLPSPPPLLSGAQGCTLAGSWQSSSFPLDLSLIHSVWINRGVIQRDPHSASCEELFLPS